MCKQTIVCLEICNYYIYRLAKKAGIVGNSEIWKSRLKEPRNREILKKTRNFEQKSLKNFNFKQLLHDE